MVNETLDLFRGCSSMAEQRVPTRDGGSIPTRPLQIVSAPRSVYGPWLTEIHYAKRIPPVTFAYGLVVADDLLGDKCVGCITYGSPASPQVARSLAPTAPKVVLELNRLVLQTDIKNAASFLISRTLRFLPGGLIVCSYADGKMGHVGYVYQAANFFYAGSATAHDHEYLINGVPTHPRTLAARGITSPKEWARANNIETVPPRPKHRYVFFTGSKKERKTAAELCKWTLSREYPKGPTARYAIEGAVQ